MSEQLSSYKLIQDFKLKVCGYISPVMKDKCQILIDGHDISELDEETMIRENIKSSFRIITESGIEEREIRIMYGTGTIGSLRYKEYPNCCGKAMIYKFNFPHGIYSMENYHQVKSDPIKTFLIKFALSCIKINGYTIVDYVVSSYEQQSLLDCVLKDRLYDIETPFINSRNKHNCINFIKFL